MAQNPPLPPGEKRTIATYKIFLLVYRQEQKSAVVFSFDDKSVRNILFMNDPKVLQTFRNGEYSSDTFLALELPSKIGDALIKQAQKDGVHPVYANLDSAGKTTYGIITNTYTRKIETV